MKRKYFVLALVVLCLPIFAKLCEAADIPYYYDLLITEADLKGKSLRDLSLMRNTIFARAGNAFHRRWLHDYFSKQSWYKATGFDESMLTPVDSKNAEIISNREAGIPREELLKRRDALWKFKLAGKWNNNMDVELGLISNALGEAVAWDPSKEMRSPLEDPKLLDKLIQVKDIETFSKRDLRILRNMIYAKHGRPFKSAILQQYFGRMAWYKSDPKYTDDSLTDVDRKNIKIVQSVETEHGGPLSEAEHAAEESNWFAAA